MDQNRAFGAGGEFPAGRGAEPGQPSAGPAGPEAAGPVRFVPVIGSGPFRPGNSGPLVPEAALAGAVAALTRPEQLTPSGHPVPEFVAGAAQMVQILAAQFPLGQLSEDAVGETVGTAQALVQAAQSLLVMATHEATTRGLPSAVGLSVPDWITTWAPDIDRTEALAAARLAGVINPARGLTATADPASPHPEEPDQDDAGAGDVETALEALGAKVTDGTARTGRASMIVRFAREMQPIAQAESLASLVTTLTDHVTKLSTNQLALAIKAARAKLKKPRDDDKDAEKNTSRRLLRRIGTVAGLAEWQLLFDDEAEAILEAALDPLTKPRPHADEHGLRQYDPRTTSQRRADALLEILGHAAATDPTQAPGSGAAKIQITTSLESLTAALSGGGRDERGHHLSAGTIRRLACDADLIPIVLGGPSEPLDVGRLKRLFTPGQRHAVYLRDRHCTFPGCTVPAAWTQIHHILHWVFGGKTDLLNAAALCQRHHSLVHTHGYTATATDTHVTWHIPQPFTATGFT